MARNEQTAAGPYWTRHWIEKMWRFTAENFVDFDTGSVDFEALGREEYEFRKALFYRKFKNSPRAKEAFDEAGEGYRTNVENGKKGGRPRKISDGDAATSDGAEDRKSTTSPSSGTLDSLTDKASDPVASNTANTDPDRGHDSGNPYDQEPSTIARPTISTNGPRQAPSRGGSAATFEGDAGHREAPDVSATVSEPMGRVPQNGTHPRIQGGKRAAQGDMSPSPSGAAQDGKISGTPEALVNQMRTVTAAPELRRAAHSPATVRSSGPMPADVQKVYDFASLEGLDKDDAYECWYVTTAERAGNDADGKPVTNWKAFVRTWCNTRSKKRSA